MDAIVISEDAEFLCHNLRKNERHSKSEWIADGYTVLYFDDTAWTSVKPVGETDEYSLINSYDGISCYFNIFASTKVMWIVGS